MAGCNDQYHDANGGLKIDSANYLDVRAKEVHVNSGELHVYAPSKIFYDTCGEVFSDIIYVPPRCRIQVDHIEIQGNTILINKQSHILIYTDSGSVYKAIVQDPREK